MLKTGWETGFFQSPNCIFDVKNLTNNEKLCYLYLCRCADMKQQSFPSYATISEKMSVTRRTAINIVKTLEEKGYLHVTKRRVNKTKSNTNIYTIIHPDQVSEMISPKECSGEMVAPKSSEMISPKECSGEMVSPNKYLVVNTSSVVVVDDSNKIGQVWEKAFNRPLEQREYLDIIKYGETDFIIETIELIHKHHTKEILSPVAFVISCLQKGGYKVKAKVPKRKKENNASKLPRCVQAQLERENSEQLETKTIVTEEDIIRVKEKLFLLNEKTKAQCNQ
jgi:predicted transcriptional regulator